MGERKRHESPFDDVNEDGILTHIISFLPLRDATRTSILSRRWRYLYKEMAKIKLNVSHVFGMEVFDIFCDWYKGEDARFYFEAICARDVEPRNAFVSYVTKKFIRVVESVLYSKGCELESFSFEFFLHKGYSRLLDDWILRGVGSNTKELILKLRLEDIPHLDSEKPYLFPFHLLTGQRGSLIEHMELSYCSLKPPSKFRGFKHLKKVDLVCVEVTDENIQKFLSCNLSLECLYIAWCDQLMNLRISRKSVRLKHLTVEDCGRLEAIKFYGVELDTFTYRGHKVNFIFKEAPKMAWAHISFEEDGSSMHYALTSLPRHMPHLKTLVLGVKELYEIVSLPHPYPTFNHLKHLIMNVQNCEGKDLLLLSSILMIAPVLEKLELRMHVVENYLFKKQEVRRFSNHCYQHMKTVIMSGFMMGRYQIEFAIDLLNNAVALQSMVINLMYGCYRAQHGDFDLVDVSPPGHKAEIEEYLLGEVPSHARLVIL